MGSQRVRHDWATELNWTEKKKSELFREMANSISGVENVKDEPGWTHQKSRKISKSTRVVSKLYRSQFEWVPMGQRCQQLHATRRIIIIRVQHVKCLNLKVHNNMKTTQWPYLENAKEPTHYKLIKRKNPAHISCLSYTKYPRVTKYLMRENLFTVF